MASLYALKPPDRRRKPGHPMQVLCLGLSRSGTDSLRSALLILGYSQVYHGFVITAKQREDCAFWVPLMERKFAGEDLQDINFDSVLGDCEAVTDGPANVFGEELMKYYPDAKVILNRRRDVDAWYKSMQNTCLQVFSAPMWVLSWFDARLYQLWKNFYLVMQGYYKGDYDRYGKETMVEHYANLEVVCKTNKRQYLDWSVEQEWEPLCEFLGKDVPDVPFPAGNKGGGQFEENMEEATKDMLFHALRNIGLCFGALALASWSGYAWSTAA